MDNPLPHPWKTAAVPSVTLVHKTGAVVALLLASAGFVVTVLWPLFAH